MRIAIIGAGAAGCFCAIESARRLSDAQIEVFEAGNRALAKVSITGGGRCNLTNSFRDIKSLSTAYPRGEKLMKRALRTLNNDDTIKWWENEGVALVTQDDQCVFPKSQDAMQVVSTLLNRMQEEGVVLHLTHRVDEILQVPDGYELHFSDAKLRPRTFDKIVVTIGGCPSMRQLSIFRSLNLEIEEPVPSLFTFNIKEPCLNALMGTVVENATLSLAGTKFRSHGALLITHWGVSGPATLKLSSYAARHLAQQDMKADLCINWLGNLSEEQVRERLQQTIHTNPQRAVSNCYPKELTQKLWLHLLNRAMIDAECPCVDVSGKKLNRLVATLTSDIYKIDGKGQYREEFVTCGGVALTNINISTMETKQYPGLFFAGEVLDVDAITGGFNLQGAWSMAKVVAQNL